MSKPDPIVSNTYRPLTAGEKATTRSGADPPPHEPAKASVPE